LQESGLDASSSLSSAALATMFECSPIAHVDGVEAPTLILTGRNDQRVPPSQSSEWLWALRRRGVAV
jgi:dipeptidyl aminopeptidase/acylaminoacyl peptidase